MLALVVDVLVRDHCPANAGVALAAMAVAVPAFHAGHLHELRLAHIPVPQLLEEGEEPPAEPGHPALVAHKVGQRPGNQPGAGVVVPYAPGPVGVDVPVAKMEGRLVQERAIAVPEGYGPHLWIHQFLPGINGQIPNIVPVHHVHISHRAIRAGLGQLKTHRHILPEGSVVPHDLLLVPDLLHPLIVRVSGVVAGRGVLGPAFLVFRERGALAVVQQLPVIFPDRARQVHDHLAAFVHLVRLASHTPAAQFIVGVGTLLKELFDIGLSEQITRIDVAVVVDIRTVIGVVEAAGHILGELGHHHNGGHGLKPGVGGYAGMSMGPGIGRVVIKGVIGIPLLVVGDDLFLCVTSGPHERRKGVLVIRVHGRHPRRSGHCALAMIDVPAQLDLFFFKVHIFSRLEQAVFTHCIPLLFAVICPTFYFFSHAFYSFPLVNSLHDSLFPHKTQPCHFCVK